MNLITIYFFVILALGFILFLSKMKIEKDKNSSMPLLRVKDKGSSLSKVVSFIIMDIAIFGIYISMSFSLNNNFTKIVFLSTLIVFIFQSYKVQYGIFSDYIKSKKKY